MSNEQIAHHAIQLLFKHHGLSLGSSLAFDTWLNEAHPRMARDRLSC